MITCGGPVIAIVLIIKKVQPAYSLILGALIGGLIGGGGLTATVNTMVSGAVNLSIGDRMKLIPFEAAIGLTSTIVSVIMYMVLH